MKMNLRTNDPFKELVREMLLSGLSSERDNFKSRVFAEVQNYSRGLQEAENESDFFFRLLELIVDCQSLGIPDDSFTIIVAFLLCESTDSERCEDDEVRQLISMDPSKYEAAKESLRNRQCIASALNREKTGRKGSIMAGKRNFSKAEQADAHP